MTRCTHAMPLPSLLPWCSGLSLSLVSWLRYSQKLLLAGSAGATAGRGTVLAWQHPASAPSHCPCSSLSQLLRSAPTWDGGQEGEEQHSLRRHGVLREEGERSTSAQGSPSTRGSVLPVLCAPFTMPHKDLTPGVPHRATSREWHLYKRHGQEVPLTQLPVPPVSLLHHRPAAPFIHVQGKVFWTSLG